MKLILRILFIGPYWLVTRFADWLTEDNDMSTFLWNLIFYPKESKDN